MTGTDLSTGPQTPTATAIHHGATEALGSARLRRTLRELDPAEEKERFAGERRLIRQRLAAFAEEMRQEGDAERQRFAAAAHRNGDLRAMRGVVAALIAWDGYWYAMADMEDSAFERRRKAIVAEPRNQESAQ